MKQATKIIKKTRVKDSVEEKFRMRKTGIPEVSDYGPYPRKSSRGLMEGFFIEVRTKSQRVLQFFQKVNFSHDRVYHWDPSVWIVHHHESYGYFPPDRK